jgi:hypothetical protein
MTAIERWTKFYYQNPRIERFELSPNEWAELEAEVREWWKTQRGDVPWVADIPEVNFLFRGLPVVMRPSEQNATDDPHHP